MNGTRRPSSRYEGGIRKAKKTYNCAGCGLPIRPGTEYTTIDGGLKVHLGVRGVGQRGMGCPQ
jgi:hypothetical protein